MTDEKHTRTIKPSTAIIKLRIRCHDIIIRSSCSCNFMSVSEEWSLAGLLVWVFVQCWFSSGNSKSLTLPSVADDATQFAASVISALLSEMTVLPHCCLQHVCAEFSADETPSATPVTHYRTLQEWETNIQKQPNSLTIKRSYCQVSYTTNSKNTPWNVVFYQQVASYGFCSIKPLKTTRPHTLTNADILLSRMSTRIQLRSVTQFSQLSLTRTHIITVKSVKQKVSRVTQPVIINRNVVISH